MRIDIITVLPEMIEGFFNCSIIWCCKVISFPTHTSNFFPLNENENLAVCK